MDFPSPGLLTNSFLLHTCLSICIPLFHFDILENQVFGIWRESWSVWSAASSHLSSTGFSVPGEFSHKEPGLSFPSSPHQFMNVICTNSSEQRAPAQFSIRGSPQLTLAKEQTQCSWYGSQGAKMESQNHLGWKSPLRWPSPTTNSPLPRPPVAHGSTSMRILNPSGNCDTTTGLGSMLKHLATLSGEEMCLKMQSNPPLEQSDTISSCPISCHSCMARYNPPSTCLDDFTELLSGTTLPSYLHICVWTIGPSSCGGCLNNDFSKTAL